MLALVRQALKLSLIFLGMASMYAMEQQPFKQSPRSPFILRKEQGSTPAKLERNSSAYSGIDSDSEGEGDDTTTHEVEVDAYLTKMQSPETSSASPEESPISSPALSPSPTKTPSTTWVSPRPQRAGIQNVNKFSTLKKFKHADKPVDIRKIKPVDDLEMSKGAIFQLDREYRQNLADLNPEFHEAIKKGDLPKANALYRAGADINSPDIYGRTALEYAMNTKNLKLLYFLQDRGVKIPSIELPKRLSMPRSKNTLVMQPAATEDSSSEEESPAISPLSSPIPSPRPIKRGAVRYSDSVPEGYDVLALDSIGKDEYGIQAAQLERKSDHLEFSDGSVIQIDTQYHASLEARNKEFHYLIKNAQILNNDFDKLKALVRRGADINISNADGEPALVQAVQQDNWPLFKFLVANGADVNKQGKRYDGTYKKIIAEPTALQEAARKGLTRYVQLLVSDKIKANPNIPDGRGTTPLMVAVFATTDNGSIEIARLLINAGANVLAKNHKGQTARDFAGMFRIKAEYAQYLKRKELEVLAGQVPQSVVEDYVESTVEH